MGKSDRAAVFGALGLVLGLGVPGGRWLAVALWAVVALLALTIANRVRRALGESVATDAAETVSPATPEGRNAVAAPPSRVDGAPLR